MRAFIALSCPDELSESLVEVQDQMKGLGSLKPVEPGNIHLTLKFLGDVDEKKVDRIIECLKGLSGMSGFDVSLAGVGVFPKPSYARVVWVGVDRGNREILKLHKVIDRELAPLGFEGDKRFSAHFTIARVKGIRDKEGFKEILDDYSKTEFGGFHAGGVELMRSELKRSGPVYSLVHRFEFK